jgi:hypothetical protein
MNEFIKAEIAKPNAKSTINSYRSFGYNLSTAIADIIDNSISASANEIHIEYKWEGQDSFRRRSWKGLRCGAAARDTSSHGKLSPATGLCHTGHIGWQG